MKINKIIRIAIHRVKQNRRRNMIIIVPIIILVIILLFINIISYSLAEYSKKIEEDISMRTIERIEYTSNEEAQQLIEQIKNIEHIDMIATESETSIYAQEKICKEFQDRKTDGIIDIRGTNSKACPNVIKGRKIEEGEEYVIIVPSKINANFAYDNVDNQIKEEDYIYGQEFLDKEITVEIETIVKEEESIEKINIEKKFKVIGIYDSERYCNTQIFYIPNETVEKVNKELKYETDWTYIDIVVDKVENAEYVENILKEKGIVKKSALEIEAQGEIGNVSEENLNFYNATQISIESQAIIEKMIIYLITISLIIVVTMLIITNINKSYLSTTEIGILRIEGYTNKDIQKITILENIFVCIVSIIIALLGFQILRFLMNTVFTYIIQNKVTGLTANEIRNQIYYLSKIPQKINIVFIIIISLILILIETINTYIINKRIFSKNISEILER